MIRQMVRRPGMRKLVVLAAMMGVTSSGTPLLVAQTSNGPIQNPTASVSLEEYLQRKAEITSLDKFKLQLSSPTHPKGLLVQDIARLRQQLVADQNSWEPTIAIKAKRALVWLDIVSAKTASERHAAIRRLPVTIIRSAPTDGRLGTVKSFVAGGKTRLQVFVPAVRTYTFSEPDEHDQPLGPSAPANTGRWKLDGAGACYWDSEDSGPDQCDPDGRWKSDGQGGCYLDPEDGGPDQCEPPSGSCYYEGAPSPCATQQEIDDALILAAEAEAEIEDAENEANADWAELEAYCSQNPWECGEEDPEFNIAGPHQDMPCSSEFTNFVAGALTANGTLITLVAIATAPVSVPAAAITGTAVILVGSLFWMHSAGTSLKDCKALIVQ